MTTESLLARLEMFIRMEVDACLAAITEVVQAVVTEQAAAEHEASK